MCMQLCSEPAQGPGLERKSNNFPDFAHCAVVQGLVQAEGERKPGQVCILSVKILAHVVFTLQEAVGEGHYY